MTRSIIGGRRITQAELLAEAKALFGDDPKQFAFACPNCGDVATVQDFIDVDKPAAAGQECIGRSLGVLTRDKPVRSGRKEGVRGCDWSANGLLAGPWTIVMPAADGEPEHDAYSFPLAGAAS